ncbi:Uu.00g071900.m01.CDS01 [Anthostomella pinea]|uniref:Uu.00g071900.m01.CDS01 n=1 Tax=Anthostomella pinea TaxID=933095 RepID=A0AAI8VVV3_9PEZI|nr:Uu.00g071900.m01.CDS01 [Anthostomella pinea]
MPLAQRFLAVKSWRRLPFIVWVVFAIFTDSSIFVFATAVVTYGVGVNSGFDVCSAANLLCLVCYLTTKFIIQARTKRRLQSKLYIFNSFGMLSIYVIVCILNFVYRITIMDNGHCIIGMQKKAMIPLISFDLVVYLTVSFLLPLQGLYSFGLHTSRPPNIKLCTMAVRTNLAVLLTLNGQPGWVCLISCNADILFSAIVIQWVTSLDNAGTASGAPEPSVETRERTLDRLSASRFSFPTPLRPTSLIHCSRAFSSKAEDRTSANYGLQEVDIATIHFRGPASYGEGPRVASGSSNSRDNVIEEDDEDDDDDEMFRSRSWAVSRSPHTTISSLNGGGGSGGGTDDGTDLEKGVGCGGGGAFRDTSRLAGEKASKDEGESEQADDRGQGRGREEAPTQADYAAVAVAADLECIR